MKSQIVLALSALAFAAPLAAQAQDVPSYSDGGYQNYSGDDQIRGRILSFDGAYALSVSDDRGYVDNVQLHQGTIINPTGLTLEPGMVVSILGYDSGPYLAANEIDTPYTFAGGGLPYYSGHPWNYYGPTIGLSFFFGGGGGGWWHGDRGYAFQRYNYTGGSRYYSNVHVDNVYRDNGNGSYHGNGYGSSQNGGAYGRGYRNGGGYSGSHNGSGYVPPQNGGGYGGPHTTGGYNGSHYGGGAAPQQNGGGYSHGNQNGGANASARRYPQAERRDGGQHDGGRHNGDQRAH